MEYPGQDSVLDDGREGEEGAQDTTIVGVVDEDHNTEFKDNFFTLPVSCGVCKRFISNEVKELVAEEVRRDKDRKTKQDPKWIARDWETLRSVVHDSYKD